MSKKLQRKDGKLMGVCAGLAEYMDLDPTVIRIAFVLSAIFMGIGIIPYIIFALIMPKR